MRLRPLILLVLCTSLAWPATGGKLAPDERIEILRGMLSEIGVAKVLLPRSRKPLIVDGPGKTYDKKKWQQAFDEGGPAARQGDQIQITKVDIEDDKITLQINGGYKGGRKWYENVQVGGGMGNSGRTVPLGGRGGGPAGTTIALTLPPDYKEMPVAEIKKMLAPVIDFEKQRSATENYLEKQPPEIQAAIKEQKAIEGMDRDQVIMSMGKPRSKTRETKDGVELEDWIYGQAPGKITFVTFDGPKVVRIRESFAGLGGSTAPRLPAQP